MAGNPWRKSGLTRIIARSIFGHGREQFLGERHDHLEIAARSLDSDVRRRYLSEDRTERRAEMKMSRPWNVSRLAGIRLMAAFAVVPVAAGAVMFITYVGLWYSGARVFDGTPSDLTGAVDVAVGLALGVAIIGFVVTWGGAVPAFLSMTARGPVSRRKVLVLGAALGNVPFAVIVVSILVVQMVNGTLSSDVARLWDGLYGTVRAIALGLLIGTSSAAVLWVIGVSGTMQDDRRD